MYVTNINAYSVFNFVLNVANIRFQAKQIMVLN